MIVPKTVTPSTVVLGSAIWREELARELVLLGLTPDQASAGALHCLQHVVARHGWPADVYQVAENPDPDLEVGEG
jgi:hypothetical protein